MCTTIESFKTKFKLLQTVNIFIFEEDIMSFLNCKIARPIKTGCLKKLLLQADPWV